MMLPSSRRIIHWSAEGEFKLSLKERIPLMKLLCLQWEWLKEPSSHKEIIIHALPKYLVLTEDTIRFIPNWPLLSAIRVWDHRDLIHFNASLQFDNKSMFFKGWETDDFGKDKPMFIGNLTPTDNPDGNGLTFTSKPVDVLEQEIKEIEHAFDDPLFLYILVKLAIPFLNR